MMDNNTLLKRKFPIDGVIFAVAAIFTLFVKLIFGFSEIEYYISEGNWAAIVFNFSVLIYLLFTITTFFGHKFKKQKVLYLSNIILLTLFDYFQIIYNIINGYFSGFFNYFSLIMAIISPLLLIVCFSIKEKPLFQEKRIVISIIAVIFYFFSMIFFYYGLYFLDFIFSMIFSIGLFFMLDRYYEPYVKESKAHNISNVDSSSIATEEYTEIYCEMAKHILLCIFTFGIWYMIWIYKATKYLNRAPEGEQYDPTSKLLLCLFVPFYQIYWFYKHGQKLDSLMKERNIGSGSDMATLCLILGIFIPIVACILMQDKFNQLCTATTTPKEIVRESPTQTPTATKESIAIDELKQYKELLDSGIITQEEFDAKKKQILGI